MDSLDRIKTRVKRALIWNEDNCRDNDKILYYMVCRDICSEGDVSVDELSFKDVMYSNTITFPSMESVRRCRQKLQEEEPTLRGEKYRQRKKELETVYRETFRK